MMKTIASRSNELIKRVASLQQKKQRIALREFIAEGLRTCTTLIENGQKLLNLFVTECHLAQAQNIASDTPIVLVSDPVMEKISAATTPSGIIGQFAMPTAPSADALESGFVFAQISDPGNMGTLIRTAAALNKKSIVIIEGVDPYNPKVVQASAGTIGMVALFQWSWQELSKNRKNMPLIALTISGGKEPSEIATNNALLMVGSEAHGIPQKWIETCDESLTLPMPGDTESLNAAVAGSIALYVLTMKN